jgi:hypothetical protein
MFDRTHPSAPTCGKARPPRGAAVKTGRTCGRPQGLVLTDASTVARSSPSGGLAFFKFVIAWLTKGISYKPPVTTRCGWRRKAGRACLLWAWTLERRHRRERRVRHCDHGPAERS